MTKRILPTPEQLRELLHYEPETGKLFWKERPRCLFESDRIFKSWNSRFSGKEALTSITDGYRCGGILGNGYLAHRVAWAIYHGKWPQDDIDHRDCCRTNNAISNLRPAGDRENARNALLRKDNVRGLKGVGIHKGRLRARISVCGKSIHLGYFTTAEDAHAAYSQAAKKYHGEFARTE